MYYLVRKSVPYTSGFMAVLAGLSLFALLLSSLPSRAWAAEEKAAIPQPIASIEVSASQLEWQLQVKEKYEYVVLSIAKPDGNVIKKIFKPGQPILFSLTTAHTFSQEKLDDGRSAAAKKGRSQPFSSNRQDGQYSSELSVSPASSLLSYSYYFTIKDGAILVPPKQPEPPPVKTSAKTSVKTGKSQSQPKK